VRIFHTAVAASALVFITPGAFAEDHRFEVAGYGGIALTAGVPVTSADGSGHVSFDDAPVYGGLFAVRAQPNGFGYLTYSRMETAAHFRPDDSTGASGSADVSIEHLQIGGNLEVTRGRLVPYLGLSLGGTRIAPVGGSGSDWSFSLTLDGGAKVELSPLFHLRAIARMPVSFVNGESSALCVSGYGCAFSYSGDPLVQAQFLLGAGLQL
jgi:hypothetical protein